MKSKIINRCLVMMLVIVFNTVAAQEIVKVEKKQNSINHRSNDVEYVITKNDEEMIKRSALYTLREFENDLNILSQAPGMDSTEVSEMIYNRCTDEKRKIFYNLTALIEDDVWNIESSTNKTIQKKQVQRYLSDFDIYYTKNNTKSVFFSNLQSSNIKKADFLYIKIVYDCRFLGRSRFSDNAYKSSKRVAEFKIEKKENKWKTWITNIHFYNLNDSINRYQNDIVIQEVQQLNKATVLENSIKPDASQLMVLNETNTKNAKNVNNKNNEARREDIAYKNLIEEADIAFKQKDYPAAYQTYQYSLKIKPNEEYAKTMSAFAKKKFEESNSISQEGLYNQWVQIAKVAEMKREYEVAKENYTKALNVKSTEEINNKIRTLSEIINTVVQTEARFNSGDYKGALKILLSKTDEKNPDYLFKTGQCYEKLNDLKMAVNAYSEAIKFDPDFIEAYQQRAAIYEQNNNSHDAIIDYTVCASLDKKNVRMLIHIAELHQLAGNVQKAKEVLKQAMNIDSTQSIVFLKMGEFLYNEDKISLALESFDRVIKIEPGNAIGYLYKGICEAELRNFKVAHEIFLKARNLGSDSSLRKHNLLIAEKCYQKAKSYFVNTKYDSAFTWINFALLINPNDAKYYFTRGGCHYYFKEINQAILDYSNAIRIDPAFVEAYKQRGTCTYQLAQGEASIKDFETVCRLGTKAPLIYKLLGDNYFQLYNYATAVSKYDSALFYSKTKNDLEENMQADIYDKRGECYYRMADYTHALENFQNALRFNDHKAASFFNCGKTYIKLGQLKEAQEFITSAIGLQPNNAFWNYILGQAYQQAEEFKNAVDKYNKAAELDTSHTLGIMPIYNRARCYISMKFYREALNDYLLIKKSSTKKLYPHFEAELGTIYLELMQPENAIPCFTKTLSDDPSDVDALYGMAVALVQKKQIDTAFSWLEKAMITGKIKREQLKEDQRINDIKNEKKYKELIKQYF